VTIVPKRTTIDVDGETRRSADIILIPKPLRAEWMDAMALDPELSATAYKVAGVLGYHFNRHSGDTFIKQQTAARLMGLSERTVWGAIVELERRGYLIVERRDLGTTTRRERSGKSTMVRNAGGKGVANTYVPAFRRSQVTATNTGRKLAEYCDHYVAQRSQNRIAKVAADCEPTLKSNPLRKRARVEHELGVAGDLLCEQLGDTPFRVWFSGVRFEEIAGQTLRLSAPTPFVKKRLTEHYEQSIIACWQKLHSSAIERVEVKVRQ
jgi:DnaA N-terminal domain